MQFFRNIQIIIAWHHSPTYVLPVETIEAVAEPTQEQDWWKRANENNATLEEIKVSRIASRLQGES